MTRVRRYEVVDVFTSRPLLDNPVAVVLDAEDLDTAAMQHIASWTNLSETTFVLPPTTSEADYRLRIFTPRSATTSAAGTVRSSGAVRWRAPVRQLRWGSLPGSPKVQGKRRLAPLCSRV